jgi:hypothetical protein
MLMSMLWSIVLNMLIHAGGFSLPADSVLNPDEKLRIEKEVNVDQRIKIYWKASERIQKTIDEAVVKDDYKTVPNNLKMWTALLSESLSDIQANLKTKKKSKKLIAYEVHVRKAISNVQSYKIRSPVEQQDIFNACLDQAKKIHRIFIDILFGIDKQ